MGIVAPWSTSQTSYSISPGGTPAAALAVREAGPAAAPKARLLDRVREAVRARRDSRRTEKAYVHWIKRYIFFHDKRHPAEMGAPEVTAFLTSLAVHNKVAASTQNQALSALVFLYREVLGVELAADAQVIRCSASPCITASEPGVYPATLQKRWHLRISGGLVRHAIQNYAARLTAALRLVQEHEDEIRAAWQTHFGRRSN